MSPSQPASPAPFGYINRFIAFYRQQLTNKYVTLFINIYLYTAAKYIRGAVMGPLRGPMVYWFQRTEMYRTGIYKF
jgi:hypothetical protein